jgi:D-sedoheptulose 7-phosphate isomerase
MTDAEIIQAALDEAVAALARARGDAQLHARIAQAAQRFSAIFSADGRVFSCGNGGSMCDAMHFAEELSGRFREDRKALSALAISDAGYITCTLNDYGPDKVFSRFVDAHGKRGDGLLAISTSGKSKNVIAAATAAKARGLYVVSLTGRPDSELGKVADLDICTPGGRFADRVQELHIKVIHILIELIERHQFS